MKAYLVGICGASCSGKTTLAGAIDELLDESVVIPLDSYYRDLSHVLPREREKRNFDIPAALDFDLLVQDIESLMSGGEITVPHYLFQSHSRAPLSKGRTVKLSFSSGSKPVIILEGLHTFYRKDLRKMIDLGIFIEAPPGLCLTRRIRRDTEERGRAASDVKRQFEEEVMPMYREYVLPLRKCARIVVDGSGDFRAVVEEVRNIICSETEE